MSEVTDIFVTGVVKFHRHETIRILIVKKKKKGKKRGPFVALDQKCNRDILSKILSKNTIDD